MMEWLQNNYEWFFSGVGVVIIMWCLKRFSRKKKATDNSINQTIGTNVKTKSGNIDISNNKQEVKK